MNTLELIDSRIRILEADLKEAKRQRGRVSIGGGVALIVIGIIFVLAGLAVAAEGVFLLYPDLVPVLGNLIPALQPIFWVLFIVGGAVLLLGLIFWGAGSHLKKKNKDKRKKYDDEIRVFETRIKAYQKQRAIVVQCRKKRRANKRKLEKLRKAYLAGKIGPKEYLRRKEALLDEING